MLCVLKNTMSMRRFFWAPKTYVKTDWWENFHYFALKNVVYLDLWKVSDFIAFLGIQPVPFKFGNKSQ